MPVGLWIRRTAEEVLLMCWPPAPEERQTCISMSSGRISTSMSSGSSGMTSTAAKEVCRRALASKGDTRTRRWTPFSLLQEAVGVLPLDGDGGGLDARLVALLIVQGLRT